MSYARISVTVISLSAAALVGIALNEGYRDEAYIPVPGDRITIGFGTTEGVRPGDTTTPPKALARALQDIQKYEGALKKCVRVPLHQREYDAYISLAYNIGPGAFCGSTLVRDLNTGNYEAACAEILRWRWFKSRDCAISANSRVCGGLWTRRQAEYALCMGNKQAAASPATVDR